MGLLDGKVAIITGAGGGLGRTHAIALAQAGAKVVINDLGGAVDGSGGDNAMADQVANEIREMGYEAAASYTSVADREGAEAILKTAIDAFGRLDIMVNNAGILRDRTLLKMEDAEFDLVMAVHTRGTYLCTKIAGAYFREAGHGGCIINTTSYSGLIGNFGQSNYAAAKAGIAGFTRTIAQEFGRMGVTVNAIAPMAKTRMTENIAAVPEDVTPEMISPFVVYLASEHAKDVTGRIFGTHGPQIFEYRMLMTDGVTKDDGLWTADEIAASMEEIGMLPHEKEPKVSASGGASPAEKVAALFSAMPKAYLADKGGAWSAILHFNVGETGSYTLNIAGGACTYAEGKVGDPSCTLSIDSADTILGMAQGKVKPEQAFMSGKLKGDNMAELMKFGQYFDMKRAAEAVADVLNESGGGGKKALSPEETIGLVFDNMHHSFMAGKAGAWKCNMHWEVKGTGEWSVLVDSGTVKASAGKNGDAALTIIIDSAETLIGMVQGKVKPEQAFMSGKLKADNMAELMKFGQFFDLKKGAALAEQMTSGGGEEASTAPAAPPLEGLNPAAVGKCYRGKARFLDPNELKAYAEATDDPNANYVGFGDDGVAPVMFPVNPVMTPIGECVTDPHTNVDLLRLVHGEQDMRFYKPLKAWDLVYPVAYFDSFEDKSSGQLMKVRQELLVDGEVACEIHSGYFIRGQKKPGDASAPKAKRPAPEPVVRDYIFSETQVVAADQPIRYGHASGDTNPIHMDDNTAKAAGHPSIILHGLCTMAFAGRAVVNQYLGGDPSRLKQFKARFSMVVLPGMELTTRGWIEETRDGEVVIGLETINQDGKSVLSNAQAVIQA